MNRDKVDEPRWRWHVESIYSSYYQQDYHGYYQKIHQFYLVLAQNELAPLYLCNRPPSAAAAILVTPDKVVFGHVGPAHIDLPTCIDDGCEMVDGHCVRNPHAERRCIQIAARYGISTDGARMYSLLKPCYECSKAIVVAGISEIYYVDAAYDEERTRRLLLAAGVPCIKVDVSNYTQGE